MATQILVVEDEPAISELITVNLKMAGHDVVCADSYHAAQKAIRTTVPDLMVVDWMLPDQSGIMLIRSTRAQAQTRDIPIIMLTARGDINDRILGLESGADDYLTKPFSPRELIARIQAMLRRCLVMPETSVIKIDDLRLDPETQRVHAADQPLTLGPIEFRLLHYFMTTPDRVHTRAHLLDQVWGNQAYVDERTVDTHVHRLRARLQTTGHAGKIETIRSMGYRFLGQSNIDASATATATS